MKQEDRLLTDKEMEIGHVGAEFIIQDGEVVCNEKYNIRMILEAQDTKSIKLRDKEWVEGVEGIAVLIEPTVEDFGEIVTQFEPFYQIEVKKWQSLKCKHLKKGG
uniref:Uncharacterized protein n=1 Tax=viral metagenome TaxID=1070528 RepID=A0A6M3LK10_9ZZZZ